MKKSKSQIGSPFKALALESKLNFYREKYQNSQQKYASPYNSITKDLKRQTKVYSSISKSNTRLKSARQSSAREKINLKNEQNMQTSQRTLNPQKKVAPISELLTSKLVKVLDLQAHEITDYSQKNTKLLKQKQRLQNFIKQAKKQLAHETKLSNSSNYNCKKLRNDLQNTNRKLMQVQSKNQTLQENIRKTQYQISTLMFNQSKRKQKSDQNNNWIKYILAQNQQLSQTEIVNLKVSLTKQQALRINFKEHLSRQLKFMQNAAINHQQLVIQQDNIKSSIEQFVNDNKMML